MTQSLPDKRLLLLRHAQAESGGGLPDHDRHLTAEGRLDAAEVGRWLHTQGIVCDLVLCSTAVRTRATWDVVAHHGGHTEFVEYRRAVYQGGPSGVLETIQEEAGEVATLLVVGHAPSMPILASVLTDGEGSAAAHGRLSEGFPTCGLALLRYAGHWSDLGPGTATLEDFVVGRA